MLREAGAQRAAIGAFTCYDLETAQAVLETAQERGVPAILLISPSSLRARSGEAFLAALCTYAGRSPAHACVQVDHVDDLRLIERALQVGATAVMADGSTLSFEDNAELVREAVRLADRVGADVEAELGRVEGDEDVAVAARQGRLTDPEEAARFVAAAAPACLAVSIGNAHGRYTEPPQLDWARLRVIHACIDAPLSLHGASGIPADDVAKAVSIGIAKVNVNTELRERYLDATEQALPESRQGAALHDLHRRQSAAVAEVVAAKLDLFRATRKTTVEAES